MLFRSIDLAKVTAKRDDQWKQKDLELKQRMLDIQAKEAEDKGVYYRGRAAGSPTKFNSEAEFLAFAKANPDMHPEFFDKEGRFDQIAAQKWYANNYKRSNAIADLIGGDMNGSIMGASKPRGSLVNGVYTPYSG